MRGVRMVERGRHAPVGAHPARELMMARAGVWAIVLAPYERGERGNGRVRVPHLAETLIAKSYTYINDR